MGFFHVRDLNVNAKSHRLTRIFEASNLAGVKRALVRWIQCAFRVPASWLDQSGVSLVMPGNASGGWLGHYRWTRKKVCFLTLVNQVNGPPGGRSRVPNGLIREEEVDDGNEQQEEGHRLTHLQPSTTAPLSCQGHTNLLGASLDTNIQHLNISSAFTRTTVTCGFHVVLVWKTWQKWHDWKTLFFKEYLHCNKTLKMHKK